MVFNDYIRRKKLDKAGLQFPCTYHVTSISLQGSKSQGQQTDAVEALNSSLHLLRVQNSSTTIPPQASHLFHCKSCPILAIHLIRAGVLELRHCLAVTISPAKARNQGEESDLYLGFHFSNSHESVRAGCIKPSVSVQLYSSISCK